MSVGIEKTTTDLLQATNLLGGYVASIVCTNTGLLIASAGEEVLPEVVAGFTSLFDDIVERAERDLGLCAVDEVTLLEEGAGRIVIRLLPIDSPDRMFLVARVPRKRSWRRNTNRLCKRLAEVLAPLCHFENAA